MESTKSTTIACVAGLLLAVPAWAQDRTHVNTAVELAEHVQDVRQHEPTIQDDSPAGAYDPEVQLAQATTEQGYHGVEETQRAFDEHTGEGEAEKQAEFVADEAAYIPRGGSDEVAGTVMRNSQSAAPWYRNPFTALLVVLGVIGAVAAVVRRWVPAARTVNSDQLQVVGRTAISSKQSVVLLHVGERVVLLGVTPDAVNTLSEITDESEVARLLGRSKSNQSVQGNFDSVLTREFENYEATEPVAEDVKQPEATAPTTATDVQEVVGGALLSPVQQDSTNNDANGSGNVRKSPLHLNDLLSRLRSLQKS